MAATLRSLLAQVKDQYARDLLSPFMRYLTGRRIAPNEVNDCIVEDYAEYRRTTAFSVYRIAALRQMVRSWNACARSILGWSDIRLTVPAYAPRFVGPSWEDFPEGLRRDISRTWRASRNGTVPPTGA
jgi:hypothetical protein